ncbi:MAG: peptide deformylase [Magnetococcales bacterium]|nr:peptide deformylase [Magnetococcales bacterium]
MARLPILTAPDRRLKQKSAPVKAVTDKIRTLMRDMAETMYAAPGIGLAAPQVGVLKRVIVVDISHYDDERREQHQLLCLANPEIIDKEGEIIWPEGCLSVPTFTEDVLRADRIRVRALNPDNALVEIEAQGLLSVCLQHEIDHLDGTLFIDHVSTLKRAIILQKLKKKKRSE